MLRNKRSRLYDVTYDITYNSITVVLGGHSSVVGVAVQRQIGFENISTSHGDLVHVRVVDILFRDVQEGHYPSDLDVRSGDVAATLQLCL